MKFELIDGSELNGESGCDRTEFLHNRRNILFSRFALSGFFVVLAHVIQDALQGLTLGAAIDSLIGLVILTAYGLNERRRHLAAKILLLTFLNIVLTLYCSVVPKHNGIFLFFFPMIGLSSVVFDSKFRTLGLFFVGLSVLSLISLVISDFQLLGDLQIPASREQNSFLINLTSSSLILVLCIHFIMKYNDESEKSLINLAQEIRQKNLKLEKTNSELDRFVYSASHDLRAPLLSIQGVVNVARMDSSTPRISDYLTMIHNQASKLDSFIKDIVCYSRNTRIEVSCQSVDINQVLNEVREELRYLRGAEQIRWEMKIEDRMNWNTDRCRLSSVLSNLISNAIKYRNKEGEDQWIRIEAKKNCANYCLTIQDNGIGIAAEHQTKVFDMFYRAHEHSTGSGLGLYIVKEIVHKMNGRIHLFSRPGEGSMFTVTFPLAAA